MNVSQSIEAALKSLLIAGGSLGGITEADCYFNCFFEVDNAQNPNHEAQFPQIQITAAPDYAEGESAITGLESHRVCNVSIIIATVRADDKTHETIADYYAKVRAALDEVPDAYSTFASTHLPAGWHCCSLRVVESGEPYFDEEIQAVQLSVIVEVNVS
jgi:hypothetical protein